MDPKNWSVSTPSVLSSDTQPSVVVFFDSARYVFNVGEQTMRATMQADNSWRKTRAIFVSQLGTHRTGGMTGKRSMMTIASFAHGEQVDLVGPPGLLHLIASSRFHLYRPQLPVTAIETSPTLSETPVYVDEIVKVYAIPLTPSPTENDALSDERKRKRSPSPDTSSKRPSRLESECSGPTIDTKQELLLEMIRSVYPRPGITRATSVLETRQGKKARKEARKNASKFDTSRKSRTNNYWKQLPTYEVTQPGLSLAYILLGPVSRGRFNGDKANTLRIPARERTKLAWGETVTYEALGEDGQKVTQTIRPEEIIDPSEPPHAVIIIDVPTPAHIPSLVDSFSTPFYSKFFGQDPNIVGVRTIYHLCGESVLRDPRYVAFMNRFPVDAYHIISSPEYSPNPITFTNYLNTLTRLNILDNEIFPLPYHNLTPREKLEDIPNLPKNTSIMQVRERVGIRPSKPPTVELSEHIKVDKGTHYMRAFKETKAEIARMPAPPSFPGKDIQVTTLGTGSSAPTMARNVLANLIRVPVWGNIILDCGEGTWGQLVRQFTDDPSKPDNVYEILRNLKFIFVSHIHGDHHMGLATILAERRKLNLDFPLYLVSVKNVHLCIREMNDLMDLGIHDPSGNGVIPIISEALNWKKIDYSKTGLWKVEGDEPWLDIQRSREARDDLCATFGLKKLVTIDMWHGSRCHGVFFAHKDGWSIGFSGDTRPVDQLVYACQGATLLIHEASMSDEEAGLAHHKGHSTIGGALEIGRRMRAQNILLTHFSGRYVRLPSITVTDHSAAIATAVDHANMRIGDMWKFRSFIPAIDSAFHDTAQPEDERAETTVTWNVDNGDMSEDGEKLPLKILAKPPRGEWSRLNRPVELQHESI